MSWGWITEDRHWHLDYAETRLLMTLCVGEIAFLRAAWQVTNCVSPLAMQAAAALSPVINKREGRATLLRLHNTNNPRQGQDQVQTHTLSNNLAPLAPCTRLKERSASLQ